MGVDTLEALRRITGKTCFESIYEKHSGEIDFANGMVRSCPVQLGGGSNLELLHQVASHIKATKVIETGVAYGWSSLAILLALQDREKGLLISTDMPYPARSGEAYVGCVVPPNLRKAWRLIRLPDRQGLPKAMEFFNEPVDLIHYDSDKSYSGRMWAYPLLWSCLRHKGVFISDDVGDNSAFKEFCAKLGQHPILVKYDAKYAGIMIKDDKPS